MLSDAPRTHRRAILDLAVRHGARNVRVFGSMARSEAVEPGRTFLGVIPLEHGVEALLGRCVEVLTDGGLSPYLAATDSGRSLSPMKDGRVYLQHIRDALEDIDTRCGDDHDAFLSGRMRQDATWRVAVHVKAGGCACKIKNPQAVALLAISARR